jgi:CheY-like chemotaxis protein
MPDRPVRILVIEDNTPDVLLVGESLREQDLAHEIVHYRDGEEALNGLNGKAPQETEFDLVILDLNMPKLGGLSLLPQLRQRPAFAEVPFLVLTSSFAPEEQREAKRLGADRYLKKPVDLYHFLNDVGRTVREMLGNRVVRDGDGRLTT